MKQLKLSELTEQDKGRKVIFEYLHGERVEGEITSWNQKWVFVKFKGPTGEACDPEQVYFIN
jgi:hypothetical protein